ncbi:hypothetical protein GQX73_g5453 [Xylaria multiplex]|uniref:PWI domain-containing protein n=1 Tax=Xylaria multiplex TaxID=323545 RepID=A0A7C8ING2_9PEZI|nr:hypothetical protein GQX73_g5453 [Xylaria multiplex]
MAASVDAKLLRATKFPAEFNQKVDMQKVNLQVMKKWIASRISEILGSEDDVVIELCFNLIDGPRFIDADKAAEEARIRRETQERRDRELAEIRDRERRDRGFRGGRGDNWRGGDLDAVQVEARPPQDENAIHIKGTVTVMYPKSVAGVGKTSGEDALQLVQYLRTRAIPVALVHDH